MLSRLSKGVLILGLMPVFIACSSLTKDHTSSSPSPGNNPQVMTGGVAEIPSSNATTAASPGTTSQPSPAAGAGPAVSTAMVSGTLTYYANAYPIFTMCSDCHYPGGQTPDWSTAASVVANAPLGLAKMQAGIMPPAKNLGPNDAETIQAWIAEGSPLGEASQMPVTPTTGTLTYTNGIKAILDRRCVACHFPNNTTACTGLCTSGEYIPDLSTYSAASSYAAIILLVTQIRDVMPPSKNATADELKALGTWLENGTPE